MRSFQHFILNFLILTNETDNEESLKCASCAHCQREYKKVLNFIWDFYSEFRY